MFVQLSLKLELSFVTVRYNQSVVLLPFTFDSFGWGWAIAACQI